MDKDKNKDKSDSKKRAGSEKRDKTAKLTIHEENFFIKKKMGFYRQGLRLLHIFMWMTRARDTKVKMATARILVMNYLHGLKARML